MQDPYDRPRRTRLRLLPIIIGALLIGFTLVRGCQEGPFGRRQVVALDAQQEAALGAQAYDQVLSQSDVLRNGPTVDVVRRLASELVAAARRPEIAQHIGVAVPQFDWECNVVRAREVNAFCLPGGKIVVYTGILPVAETESALATVMGHEIAHALAHHGAERMAQQQMLQIAQSAAAGAMSDMSYEQQREILGVLGAGGKFGVLLPFSRKHESEADRIGLILMAAAGYDPHRAAEFWQRMAKSSRGGQPPEFASTHPSHERRIHDLEASVGEAMPFYESAPTKRPDRKLPGL
jgi:predicted Zn-dependent protease